MTHPNPIPAPRVVILMAAVLAWPALAGEDPVFEDVTDTAGLDFTYDNGASGRYWFPEIMGGGAAILDYDGDGRLDLYLVQGGALGPDKGPADRQGDRLFRNLGGGDRPRFSDVTESAGIDARGYGMGVTVGDYDGDGDPDLYAMNYGDNQLWRNDGDGTFTDVTDKAGVNDPRWSVSGSFADYDGDGDLDLYVANYADFTFDNHRDCRSAGLGERDYCSPSAYDGVSDTLFRNDGDGRFVDVSDRSGIASASEHGLGVISLDFDGDGRLDIYVANDGDPNHLWLNRGDMTFEDDSLMAGSAVNSAGMTEAGMGVDAADVDGNGAPDLFLTHMRQETNTLYLNDGKGWFRDMTSRSGLGTPSYPMTGFGTRWLDIDNDGRLDLVAVNGAVVKEKDLAAAGDAFPYHQTNQVFVNRTQPGGELAFEDASARSGAAFEASHVSRGAAFGDLDDNGTVDILIVNINGPARVLMNRSAPGHHWLGLRLAGPDGRVERPGAVAWLLAEGDRQRMLHAHSDGSYASASDPRVVFGLGNESAPRTVEVVWPGGQREIFSDLQPDRYHVLHAGTGNPIPTEQP